MAGPACRMTNKTEARLSFVQPADRPARIESVRIRGFRSLKDVELRDLPDAQVLIGANGSGKSNFIRFFDMLSWMLKSRQLGEFVERQGGADDQLYRGNRFTPRMEAEVRLRTDSGLNDYRFALAYGSPDRFYFSSEEFRFSRESLYGEARWTSLEGGHREAKIVEAAQSHISGIDQTTASVIVKLLRNCTVYQFHDTSAGASIKRVWDVQDNYRLRSDGGNLAAILYYLEQHEIKRYELICRHIGRILPVFDRFSIDERFGKVQLRWKAKHTGRSFGAHLTSDGSLRFMALATLLNLPHELMPDVILLDEPELGLHPAAITLVADMIRVLSEQRQVILATQSPLLVDCFELDEMLVLELHDDATVFRQLDSDQYTQWLDDFTTGELWQQNLLGGRP